MTQEPTTGPAEDEIGRHRRGASMGERVRNRRFVIGVATVLAVAAVTAGLVKVAFTTASDRSRLLPPTGATVSDVAAPWQLSPTDAFGASAMPSASAHASPSAADPAAPDDPRAAASTAAPKTQPRATVAPQPAQTTAAAPTSYEAEGPDSVRSSGTRLRHVSDASGGYVVGNLGRGETVRFSVTVASAGRHTLTICYISGDQRGMMVRVNGGHTMWGTAPATPDWYTVGSLTISVNLSAGGNTIELGNPRDYAPDIDRIVLR